jgi:ATP-dependent Lon protease
MNKAEERIEIEKYLSGPLKINSSAEDAKKKLEKQIGFEREKENFSRYVYLYSVAKEKFKPVREIICYAGAPGTGKTTFVRTLNNAMERGELRLISCAGLKKFKDFSILGDENKPSLVAWAIKKSGCKNPIILLDELEKITDEQIQRDLIELFAMYKNEEGGKQKEESKKLFDKYYGMEIELDHISFFATVNYPKDLVPLLKNSVDMRVLEDYTNEEKKAILRLKKAEIEEEIKATYREEKDIIPEGIIEELPNYIREDGIRQAERVLYKIKKEYIVARESGEKFELGEPQQWLKSNVLPYQERFYFNWKHYCFLFPLWVIMWILLLIVIIKKIILREKTLVGKITIKNG